MRVVTTDGVIELGTVEDAPTIGITDYSRRVTDAYGVTTVVKRGFAHRLSVRLAVPFADAPAVQRQLAALRATPATWIADDRFANLTVRGLYKDFELDHAVPPLSFCTLTVDGLAEDDTFVDDGTDPAPAGDTSTLKLLAPIEVTDAVLLSSSVAEDDAAPWAAGATYAKGARVILAATHRIYESLEDANLGNDPAGVSDKWLDVGPTSRWAMFDQALGSTTSATAAIEVMLKPGPAVSGLAILDTTAASVRVRAGSYDRTIAVTDGANSALFLDFAAPAGATVTVTLTPRGAAPVARQWDDGAVWDDAASWRDTIGAGDGTVEVGTLLIGHVRGLGVTEASPTSGITDYSRKETDDFGEVTIVPRAWSKRMAARALIRSAAIDQVIGRIAAVRALPSLWIGDTDLDSLVVYGFFKEVSITVGESLSKLSLSIEGLSTAGKVAPIGGGAGTVDWTDIGDKTGTKPADNADVTGDNTAKDTHAIGGKPATEILANLLEIDAATRDISALKDAKVVQDRALGALVGVTADQAAAQRQADRDVGRLEESLLRALMEDARSRAVLRDAGIIVDPATGVVRIYAVDQIADRTATAEVKLDAQRALINTKASVNQVNELIAAAVLSPEQVAQLEPILARLTSVEQDMDGLNAAIALKAEAIELTRLAGVVSTASQTLDALNGMVATKAERTDVDLLGIRVGSTEQQLLALPNTSGFSVTVRQARGVAEGAAEASLRGLLSGDAASRFQIGQIAEVHQQLTATIADERTAAATARTQLVVSIADARALTLDQAKASIDRDGALSERITAQGTILGEQGAAIGVLQQTAIGAGGGIAGITTTIRQQIGELDLTGDAVLRALVAGDEASRGRARQLVQIQTEFSTTLVANEAASAIARQALVARMAQAEAAIVTTTRVVADTTKALTERQDAFEAVVTNPVTGLPATRSRLIDLEDATASANDARVREINQLDATLNDPATGLPVVRGSVGELRDVVVGPGGAAVRAMTVLDANGRVSGLAQTNDGAVATFGVTADVFSVHHPVTDEVLFYVDAEGAIVGRLKARSVTADNIKPGAVLRVSVKVLEAPVAIPWG